MSKSNRQRAPRDRRRPFRVPRPPCEPRMPSPPPPVRPPDPGCSTGPDLDLLKRLLERKKKRS